MKVKFNGGSCSCISDSSLIIGKIYNVIDINFNGSIDWVLIDYGDGCRGWCDWAMFEVVTETPKDISHKISEVICITRPICYNITVGKKYKVLNVNDNTGHYKIVDDNGDMYHYKQEYFDLLVEDKIPRLETTLKELTETNKSIKESVNQILEELKKKRVNQYQ